MSRHESDEVKRIAAKLDGWGSVGAEVFITKEEILDCESVDEIKKRINEKLVDALETIHAELGL